MEEKSNQAPDKEKKISFDGDQRNGFPSSLQYLQPGFANPSTSSIASHESKGSYISLIIVLRSTLLIIKTERRQSKQKNLMRMKSIRIRMDAIVWCFRKH